MDNFIFVLFAGIGFMVTFASVIFGVMKLHNFFENDFPQIKMNQDEIYQKIHLLQQRVHELEEKVND